MRKLLLTLFIFSLLSTNINAQWSNSSSQNNAVASLSSTYAVSKAVSDNNGGAIIAWTDDRNSNHDIYIQRVNGFGNMLWTTNGVAIATGTGNQTNASISSDGGGGAFVAWEDTRNGSSHIYAQHINASGVVQWTANGVALCTAAGNQYSPVIISDDLGGAYIVWQDNRSTYSADGVVIQHIDASGTPNWTTNGILACNASNNQYRAILTLAANNGVIVAWQDDRQSSAANKTDIYAQMFDISGSAQWPANGVAICTAANVQNYPAITTDGNGGAIIGWMDYRSTTGYDIYMQRINSGGTVQWTANGVNICNQQKGNYPVLLSDGNNGAFITWSDWRTGSTTDIYGQLVNGSGVAQWTANGVAICVAATSQTSPAMTLDGNGGMYVSWTDSRNADMYGYNVDIYAQRVKSDGTFAWATNGIAVCNAGGDQGYISMVSDGNGNAIVLWDDLRNSGGYNAYAEMLMPKGFFAGIFWNGGWNSNWSYANNWTPATVPTSTDDVFFPPLSIINEPVIDVPAFANNMIISSARTISSGNQSLTVSGNINSNGNIISDGSLILNGSSAQTISGTNTIGNFGINNSAGVTIKSGTSNKLNITGILSVTNGTLTTNNNLTLKSSSISNTAMVDNVTGAINGDVTVERFIPAGQRAFRLITPSVTTTSSINANWQEAVNNTATGYASNKNPNPGYGTHISGSVNGSNGFDATVAGNASMFTFNNDHSQTWNIISNTNTNILNAGTAYRILIRGSRAIDLTNNSATPDNTTLRATGTLKTGTVVYNIGSTPSLSNVVNDYNLVGNPYCAAVDWTTINTNQISSTYYIWDPTIAGSNNAGGYVSFTTGTGGSAGSAINQYIQPGQAIFVQTTGTSPSITFHESDKSVASSNLTATFGATQSKPRLDVLLYVANNANHADATSIIFDAGFKKEVFKEDALKLSNPDENIAVNNNNTFLGIDARPLSVANDSIHLSIWNELSKAYTLKISASNFADYDGDIFLKDNYTNQTYPVAKDASITAIPFEVTADTASQSINRFVLVLNAKQNLITADNSNGLTVTIAENPVHDKITINYTAPQQNNTIIRVINSNGLLLFSKEMGLQNKAQVVVPASQFAKGLYLVEVVSGGNSVTKKVIKN